MSETDGSARVTMALSNLEALAASGSSEAVKRAACRDLLEFEGKIGPGSSIRARRMEHKVDEKIIGVFVAVLTEVRGIDRSVDLEGEGVGDAPGDSEVEPILPV